MKPHRRIPLRLHASLASGTPHWHEFQFFNLLHFPGRHRDLGNQPGDQSPGFRYVVQPARAPIAAGWLLALWCRSNLLRFLGFESVDSFV